MGARSLWFIAILAMLVTGVALLRRSGGRLPTSGGPRLGSLSMPSVSEITLLGFSIVGLGLLLIALKLLG
ncbi:MAG: hypothetical protein OEM67_04920 [Thermoleophilia bacterium]|nr:hypothetical protein [Thermoleophilia bacterium]